MTDPSQVRVTGLSTQSAVEPIDVLLHRFRRYLVVERGLRDKGATDYARAVRPFLEGRLSHGGLCLDRLSAAEVTEFVVESCPRLSPGTVKLTMTALRSLLGFLHLEGTIERPLAGAVPSAASWRLAALPKRLEPSQVRSLLASCDLNTATGRRDFAILTALVRLGLRAGELAALRFEDIDWRAGEIVVRGKGRREERLPLPADIGEAVAAYLRDGRPETARVRSVFVTVNAPHRSMSSDAVSAIVARAASRCGLAPIRAHRLRHTAASETLRGGASLEEVGQLLRHRRAMTTAIYAKVDREALRKVARPWPGAAQ
jgi:integrase/recombinase XerD